MRSFFPIHLQKNERSVLPMKAEKPELLDRIMAYIEKQYSKPLTVKNIAEKFFISSSTVSHLFKQKIGVSFYQYVTQRRLIAGKLLIEKGIPMEDVAIQTGYQVYSCFYRAFKQEFGISPDSIKKCVAIILTKNSLLSHPKKKFPKPYGLGNYHVISEQ